MGALHGRSRPRAEGEIHLLVFAEHPLDAEVGSSALGAALAEGGAARLVTGQCDERISHRSIVARRRQNARLAIHHQFVGASHVGGHDRQAGGHRFLDGVGQPLRRGAEDEDVQRPENLVHVVAVAEQCNLA
jgi:hypothetical protein